MVQCVVQEAMQGHTRHGTGDNARVELVVQGCIGLYIRVEGDVRGQGMATHVPTSIHIRDGYLTTDLTIIFNLFLPLQITADQPQTEEYYES